MSAKWQSALSNTAQSTRGAFMVTVYRKCPGRASAAHTHQHSSHTSQDHSSMEPQSKANNCLGGWMFWKGPSDLSRLSWNHFWWKGDKRRPLCLQQQSVTKTKPVRLKSRLQLSSHSLTWIVFMAQWDQLGRQAPYWFKNSRDKIGLACTAAYIHTLVWI